MAGYQIEIGTPAFMSCTQEHVLLNMQNVSEPANSTAQQLLPSCSLEREIPRNKFYISLVQRFSLLLLSISFVSYTLTQMWTLWHQ